RSHQSRRTDADGGTLDIAYARHFAQSIPPPCESCPELRHWLMRWSATREPVSRFFLFRVAAFGGASSRPSDSLGHWDIACAPDPKDAGARDTDRRSARRRE